MRAGLPFGWDWVEAAFVPRMASGNPAYRQASAMQPSVALDCFDGEVRAGGMESAMLPQKRADAVLVSTNHGDQDSTHGCFSMVSQAWARVALKR
jgi:hypothetical protein